MAKQFTCESCGQLVVVRASGVGEEILCRRCGAPMLVPSDAAVAPGGAYEQYLQLTPVPPDVWAEGGARLPAGKVVRTQAPSAQRTPAEEARASDTIYSLVIAGLVTWALPKYVLLPLLAPPDWEPVWWMYVGLFLVAFASVHTGATWQRAADRVAYGDVGAEQSEAVHFCTKCGRGLPDDAGFCSGCGAKVEP